MSVECAYSCRYGIRDKVVTVAGTGPVLNQTKPNQVTASIECILHGREPPCAAASAPPAAPGFSLRASMAGLPSYYVSNTKAKTWAHEIARPQAAARRGAPPRVSPCCQVAARPSSLPRQYARRSGTGRRPQQRTWCHR